jgi:hypothetical protein
MVRWPTRTQRNCGVIQNTAEELWQRIAPLLPPAPPHPKGGRPPPPDRQVLVGIVFMLLTGCAWRHLPAKALGCGSPTGGNGSRSESFVAVCLTAQRRGRPSDDGTGSAKAEC